MARETRTEYETKEKTIEYTVCDCCDLEADDTVELSLNPQERRKTDYDLISVHEDKEGAVDAVSQKMIESQRNLDGRSVTIDPRHSYGLREKNHTTLHEAEVTFDVCMGCLRDVFGVDLPDDYESVSLNSGTLNVEVESIAPITLNSDGLEYYIYALAFAFAGGGLIGTVLTMIILL